MREEASVDTGIVTSIRVVSGLLIAAFSGGAGLGVALGPQADKTMLSYCIDNANLAVQSATTTATTVERYAGEHSRFEDAHTELRRVLYDLSVDQYTATNAATDKRTNREDQGKTFEIIHRRLDSLERALDKLEDDE